MSLVSSPMLVSSIHLGQSVSLPDRLFALQNVIITNIVPNIYSFLVSNVPLPQYAIQAFSRSGTTVFLACLQRSCCVLCSPPAQKTHLLAQARPGQVGGGRGRGGGGGGGVLPAAVGLDAIDGVLVELVERTAAA